DRRDQRGPGKADRDIGANIGSVAAGLLAQDRQPQPGRQERADHRGKAEADDIDTIVGGPEPAGEHDDVDQSQGGGNDVPREIDRAFPYEHRGSPVEALLRSSLTRQSLSRRPAQDHIASPRSDPRPPSYAPSVFAAVDAPSSSIN